MIFFFWQSGVFLRNKARVDIAGHKTRMGGAEEKDVRSMMPGKVVELLVNEGDQVEKDQSVIVIEAMKMENEIRAAVAGTVKAIHVEAGQVVESGELLIELEEA